MTGWRVGYLMAPGPFWTGWRCSTATPSPAPPAMIQAACLAALDWDPEEMARAYETRRGYICRRLRPWACPAPGRKGPSTSFPPLAAGPRRTFCLRLIQDAGVAAVPEPSSAQRVRAHVLLLLHGTSAGGHGPGWSDFLQLSQ